MHDPIDIEAQYQADLALAAQFAICGAGGLSRRHWLAALGYGLCLHAAPRQTDSRGWPAYGQDALACDAGLKLGVHLRDLHPPQAAVGLELAPEFAEHYVDSYIPLLVAALDQGLPVLAWRACSQAPWAWVCLHAYDHSEGRMLARLQTGAQTRIVPADLPAVQCYAVEQVVQTTWTTQGPDPQPTAPEPAGPELARLAVGQAARMHDPRLLELLGLRSGAAAIEALAAASAAGPPECWQPVVRAWVARLQATAGWVEPQEGLWQSRSMASAHAASVRAGGMVAAASEPSRSQWEAWAHAEHARVRALIETATELPG